MTKPWITVAEQWIITVLPTTGVWQPLLVHRSTAVIHRPTTVCRPGTEVSLPVSWGVVPLFVDRRQYLPSTKYINLDHKYPAGSPCPSFNGPNGNYRSVTVRCQSCLFVNPWYPHRLCAPWCPNVPITHARRASTPCSCPVPATRRWCTVTYRTAGVLHRQGTQISHIGPCWWSSLLVHHGGSPARVHEENTGLSPQTVRIDQLWPIWLDSEQVHSRPARWCTGPVQWAPAYDYDRLVRYVRNVQRTTVYSRCACRWVRIITMRINGAFTSELYRTSENVPSRHCSQRCTAGSGPVPVGQTYG